MVRRVLLDQRVKWDHQVLGAKQGQEVKLVNEDLKAIKAPRVQRAKLDLLALRAKKVLEDSVVVLVKTESRE